MSDEHKLHKRSQIVKSKAENLGFISCGISKAEYLEEEATLLEKWLSNGMHGQMHYMESNFDKRVDPRKLFPGAKSVISLAYNYFPTENQNPDSSYKVSNYAYGRDYHKVIRKKLKEFLAELSTEFGDIAGRGFVDSAPVMDKAWATRSGVGWLGKNSNIIHPKKGSYFFLAEIITDLALEADPPIKDYCGTCTRCIDACPTDAIESPYVVNGSKCISYLTIELKDSIPREFHNKMEGWIFGCDICQQVCPWNRFSSPSSETDFDAREPIKEYSDKDWEELTEELFEEHFRGTPLKRAGFEKLKKSVKANKHKY